MSTRDQLEEQWLTCPSCNSPEEQLDFAMHYPAAEDEDCCEMFHCKTCGAIGDAEDCRSIGAFPPPETSEQYIRRLEVQRAAAAVEQPIYQEVA